MNFIIGTAILWALTGLVVRPLANHWLSQKLAQPAYADISAESPGEEDEAVLRGLAVKYYILASMLVLGVAGLIGGLLGYWFVGISFEARSWPGVIMFIVASLIGVAISGSFAG